jgi:hypothetical protein
MPRKRRSREQEKAMFAKMKNRVYKRYHRIEMPEEQRELKKDGMIILEISPVLHIPIKMVMQHEKHKILYRTGCP